MELLIFQLYANQIEVNPIEIENEIESKINNTKKLKYFDLSEIEIINDNQIQKTLQTFKCY